jgi:hypothetical protein
MVRCGGRLFGRGWMGLEGLIKRGRNVLIVYGYGGERCRRVQAKKSKELHIDVICGKNCCSASV